MNEVRCRCGARMAFAVEDATGKKIPLDLSSPVYAVTHVDPEEPGRPEIVHVKRANLENGVEAFVSHFRTCPRASEFSKGGDRGR